LELVALQPVKTKTLNRATSILITKASNQLREDAVRECHPPWVH
jgi:hypothetical protein